jgi:tetratricopeptide (TPR) repeat protein
MPAPTPHAEWAKKLAEQLIASGDLPPENLDDQQRLALAWALKNRTVIAWSSAPSEVTVVAAAIERLQQMTVPISAAAADELAAIAAWIAGITELIRGGMTNALEHLDRAQSFFLALGRQEDAAQTQVPKIMALAILGQHEEAIAIGVSAQKIFIEHGDSIAAAKVNLNLGNLYCQRSQFREAIRRFEFAQAIFEDRGDFQFACACEIGRAEAYASIGDMREALNICTRAIDLAKARELWSAYAIAIETMAGIQLACGKYGEALRLFEMACQKNASLNLPQNLAMSEKQLGDVYADLRLLPESLALIERALSRFHELEMPVEAAWALVQRGRLWALLGYGRSDVERCLVEAQTLFSQQSVVLGEAAVLLTRAELALSEDDSDAAYKFAEEVRDLLRGTKAPSEIASACIVMGHARLREKDVLGGLTLFSNVLKEARTSQFTSIEVRCLIGIGLCQLAAGERDLARSSFEDAIALFEEQRRALPGDDFRTAFLGDHLRPYQELLSIELQDAVDEPTGKAIERVFIQLERFRARELLERLGDAQDNAGTEVPRGKPNKFSAYSETAAQGRARLNWLYRRAQLLLDEGEDVRLLVEETKTLERELLEQARRSRLSRFDNQEIAVSPRDRDHLIDPAALCAALQRDDAIVEYGRVNDELFACVIKSGGVSIVRNLSQWSQVIAAIQSGRFQIDAARYGDVSAARYGEVMLHRTRIALKKIYDLVWSPLENLLTGCGKVIVVPHEQLGAIQFASLYDGANYLAERFVFSLAPSAQIALRGLNRIPRPPKRVVALGESTRLFHAAEEAKFVAGLFPQAITLLGNDATGSALARESSTADIVHLACHGQFRSDNPMFSALHLVDTAFTVKDAEQLSLSQCLVTLSACESGASQYARGDEMLGLVRGFLIGGAARIVASLWPVNDAITMQYMETFYTSLQGGDAPAAALQKAQLAAMKNHPHPFHWAAFTLYGGW